MALHSWRVITLSLYDDMWTAGRESESKSRYFNIRRVYPPSWTHRLSLVSRRFRYANLGEEWTCAAGTFFGDDNAHMQKQIGIRVHARTLYLRGGVEGAA